MLDEDYGPTCCSQRFRRARVRHRCCACGETILPRDRYHYTSGLWDGEPDSFKHCLRCWALFCELQARSVVGEVPALALDCGESWFDVFGDDPPPEVQALAFQTRDEAQALLGARAELGSQ